MENLEVYIAGQQIQICKHDILLTKKQRKSLLGIAMLRLGAVIIWLIRLTLYYRQRIVPCYTDRLHNIASAGNSLRVQCHQKCTLHSGTGMLF